MANHNDTNHSVVFMTGVVAGSAAAAALLLYLRPELRKQAMTTLKNLSDAAAGKAQSVANGLADVVERVADAADDATARAQEVRDEVASAVQHGAHVVSQSARDVERLAKASKTVHQH